MIINPPMHLFGYYDLKKSIHIGAYWTALSPIPIYLSQAISPALEI